MRRALTREAVEAQVAGNLGDRPLPPAYLVLFGLGEDGRDDFAVAFLLRCRANGFMIAVPSVTRIREYVEGLLTGDGEPLALVHREQVQAETVRGRHLGPSHVLLLDFPWAALEYLVAPQALRGISDRASRVITLQVGTTPPRPCAGDTLDAAARWVERLDPDTAQEYYISAQEHEEAEEHMEQDDLAQPEPELRPPAETARTTTAPPAGPAKGQSAPRTGALFGSAAPLTAQEITRLRALAGGAPARTGNVERAALVGGVGPMIEDLHAEADAEALPPADVEDPALDAELHPSPTLQTLLLAQMRQNALLLQKLTSSRTGDGIQDALSGGGASGSDSSSGIKGHLAREAFLRQLADSRAVAAKVQANALTELGLATPEPGLMRTYIEKRLPLNDQKTLQHVASMAAFGWEAGFKSDNQELMAFASRLLVFSEQVALDSGRIQLGYLLAGFPDPTPLGFNSRRVPGLRTFSRLAPAQWLAANLAYLKDLDYAESRIAQLGTGRPVPPPKVPNAQEAAESEEGQPPPRRPPRRPKNATQSA